MSDGPINIATLNIQQLERIKQSLEDDLSQLSNSLNALKQAAAGYYTSQDTLKSITPENEGREVLIPLTNSLYIPGVISQSDSVIVDIGGNFFVEKKVKNAEEYFGRRIDFVKNQMEQFQDAINSKRNSLEQIVMVMQQKIASISQQQASGPGGISGLKI